MLFRSAELEARKAAINDLYDATAEEWNAALEAFEEPIENVSSLFAELGIDLEDFQDSLRGITGGRSSGRSSVSARSEGSYSTAKGSRTAYYNKAVGIGDGPSYTKKTTDSTPNEYKYFDAGGVLKGLGGIKATGANEIVVPPSIAGRMLSPDADSVFRTRMSELGYLYGASSGMPATLLAGGIGGNVTNNNGATYHLGGITLTEGQAKQTTVYELARLAHGLRAYSS